MYQEALDAYENAIQLKQVVFQKSAHLQKKRLCKSDEALTRYRMVFASIPYSENGSDALSHEDGEGFG